MRVIRVGSVHAVQCLRVDGEPAARFTDPGHVVDGHDFAPTFSI